MICYFSQAIQTDQPYCSSWLRASDVHEPRASYCLWPQGSLADQSNLYGCGDIVTLVYLDLIMYHSMQAILDCLENLDLFEWINRGLSG